MQRKEKIISIILILVFLTGFMIYNSYYYGYEKINFNKNEAKNILEDTWMPIKEFNDNLRVDKINNLILPPEYINNKDDFINFFSATIPEYIAQEFYPNLIIEDKYHGLIVNEEAYFPIIYKEDSYVSNAYIRKNRKMKESELVIEESGFVRDKQAYRRRNYYGKGENGEWIFEYFEGNSWYFFNTDKEK